MSQELLALAAARTNTAAAQDTKPAVAPAPSGRGKPNILVIFGDDIGQTNVSAYTHGLMGYWTPNIDRIAREGLMFTDYYAEQSCTAGRKRPHQIGKDLNSGMLAGMGVSLKVFGARLRQIFGDPAKLPVGGT